MHIKRITIQGFKTYKNTTVIDLLSPHHNVVVGRNGSGKSNFFAAIRFVLSDAYTHMTREERQGLIHEGSGTVMSAYVEIVFDNTDGRFPVGKDEISIRRTIGLKKDDYSLDGKSATRSDIMNLLESAGFSRSNPYYIVPQGRITSLTNSQDAERLTLLKEVSGATVFESKLKESMKEMLNSNYKLQRIDETLGSIDNRLSDLQIESTDLKEFQQLEKSKKVLHYNLYDREFSSLTGSIEEIETKYNDILGESQDDLKELDSREQLCQELSQTINNLKVTRKVSRLEKEQYSLDFNQLLKEITDKEISLNEAKFDLVNNTEKSQTISKSIAQYKNVIQKSQSHISKFQPELSKLQVEESKYKEALSKLTANQRAIYSKQNRFQKFENKAERDKWLNSEISKLKKSIKTKNFELNQINIDIKTQETNLKEINEGIVGLENDLSKESSAQTTELKHLIHELKSKLTDLVDQRKTLWRKEIKYKSMYDSVNNELINATNTVHQTMDRSQARGLESVKAIAAKLNLTNNVFGPIVDLITVSDKYKISTEVIAGNALFHVVVDNDNTASLIMQELVRTNGGRVTFIPLNRIQPNEVKYPDSQEFKCIPLLKKLKFDASVEKAVRQIFGRVIVCHDLQTGTQLAKEYKLSAITLDGDRSDLKGVMTGGFRDFKKSRIDLIKFQTKMRQELAKAEADLRECSVEIESLNQKTTSANSELQLNVRDLDKIFLQQEPKKIELSKLRNNKFNLEKELNSSQSNYESINLIKENYTINLKQFEQELNSSFTDVLNPEELEQLELLNREIGVVEGSLDSVVTRLAEVETEISTYESELQNVYNPQLLKLTNELLNLKVGTNSVDITELEESVEALRIQLDTVESKNTVATESFNEVSEAILKSEESLKNANNNQITIIKKLEKFSKVSEKTLNKKSIMINRRDEINKKIRELGVLPELAFQQSNFDKYDSNDLVEQLNVVNDGLLKFSHINKKAIEQYTTFTKQRDDLVKRREELNKSHESIEELILNLKLQKNNAIKKSFRQVAKSFNEIFEKLVPLGVGNLIMQRKQDGDDEDEIDEDEDQQASQTQIENYVGVSISVSFNSKHDEQQRIEQLSGGQKSLCAIALILAIQTCDPAPFYLFDEIDANLDTQYRTAVASMINTLSRGAQFICTTFRPEMLQVADKFYGVMFNNKVSSVSEINREEAMSFIVGQLHR